MFFITKLLSIILILVPTWGQISWSEDIEIYRGQSIGIRNNAVILMDTSGSMGWYEEDIPSYKPETVYKVHHAFQSDQFYYSNDSVANIINFNSSKLNTLKQQSFNINALICKNARENLPSSGFYSDSFKRWNDSSRNWNPSYYQRQIPSGSNSESALIECKTDEGKHGIIDGNYFVNTRNNTGGSQFSTATNISYYYEDDWSYNFRYLYSGNFLNYRFELKDSNENRTKPRMQIATEAAISAVNSSGGVRLGLMRFDSNSDGGFVDIAANDIEVIQSSFENKLNNYLPWGGTPLSESLYEAAMYYSGGYPKYGSSSNSRVVKPGKTVIRDADGFINYNRNRNVTEEKNTPSASDSMSGSKYLSPINSACQTESSLVLFTDGEPSNDTGANADIRKLIKYVDFPPGKGFDKQCDGNGGCADELAYYLSHYDQNRDLPGTQIVKTSVIGGFFDKNDSNSANAIKYMESIAAAGLGEFHLASDGDSIALALGEFIGNTSSTPATFVAPAVAANSFNSLEHLDQLYYAMFVPKQGDNWSGNLKSYRLNSEGKVVDSKNANAIIDGVFTPESRSYWTDPTITDGAKVLTGGAASRLSSATADSNPAKIFTYLGSTSLSTPATLADTLDKATITKRMLGLDPAASDVEHQRMIDWGNRVDTNTGVRLEMEDPLHSRPLVVTYNRPADSNGKIVQDGVVFVGSNSGYLHAFKADKLNFKNYFSFIPKELLKNIPKYVNGEKVSTKTYGVDGPINYWHTDFNKNGQVDIADGEKIFLFFGLRRGGAHYYALDITNPDRPKFAWQIDGGTTDFKHLGQTWSNMTLAKVPWKGSEKVVLIFGAGYDANEDTLKNRATNTLGKAIYMIDAQSGKKLWDTSLDSSYLALTQMKNSITADITPVDFDGDSITDYFYAADVGGRIWRFDINKSTSSAKDFATGGMIFDANSSLGASYQRFYNAPSIAYFTEEESANYLAISIGSGFRAHPLEDSSQDSFYTLKDYNVSSQPKSYVTLTPQDLADLKGNPTASQKHNGWKLALSKGEKVLSKSLTTKGDAYFTTFSPTISQVNTNSCTADIGSSRAYIIDFQGDNNPDPLKPPTGPVVEVQDLSSVGITPEIIELRTTSTGTPPARCLVPNPPEDCLCLLHPKDPKCDDNCENSGSVILSGTLSLGGGAKICDLVDKDYWTIQ